jgi:hypothetical protein
MVLMAPLAARAQGSIAGSVKDTSGAVLPGVVVEASSDALIEKTRSAVSDSAGPSLTAEENRRKPEGRLLAGVSRFRSFLWSPRNVACARRAP